MHSILMGHITLTVAIVGTDGAGKSTVVRGLSESLSVPCKKLYMGPNIESSNVALPRSRLALRLSFVRTDERPAERASPIGDSRRRTTKPIGTSSADRSPPHSRT